MKKSFRPFRSFASRILFSYILVAILGSVIGGLLLAGLFAYMQHQVSASDYRAFIAHIVAEWQLGAPDGQPNPEGIGYPAGFTLIASPDNQVVFTQGDTPCRAGMFLSACAPEWVGHPPEERFFDQGSERWTEIVLTIASGETVIAQRGPAGFEPSFIVGSFYIYGTIPFTLTIAVAMAVFATPVALALGLLLIRPSIRRLSKIAAVSNRFADGELSARVSDSHPDEVGGLARQFDDMADALSSNIQALRDLAARNAELAQQAEQAAIQTERVRLSRDLHDAIAQRLFSLSVSTSTLPDIIQQDREKGVEQAKIIASIAEQTLLDLRALLLELRPTGLVQQDFPQALRTLCSEWQSINHIPVDCSMMLTGRHIPALVEDMIYRVAQEALSNVAKHAKATCVNLSLVEGQRQITLSITDNGTGFDPAAANSTGKFGLLTMRERAGALGGSVAIESDTARGTTLKLVVPIERQP
jgi:signal transduction histidine kinase